MSSGHAQGDGVLAPSRGSRVWPWLLVPVALLPDLGAVLPLRSYYFRDFTLGFYPLRLFQARELLAGHMPFWNPYLHEGAYALPAFYPLDLLHVVWPSAAFVSWLLTLHLPLAALLAYALARDLGRSKPAAFVGGSIYALGGYALSCLNLYVFLQALAWAPLLALALRRAAARGRRWIVLAAAVLALSLSTLALELVAQALAVALLVTFGRENLQDTPAARAATRTIGAVLLGCGLAAVPVCVTLAVLQDAPRGGGFSASEAVAFAVPPVGFLQTLVANLFGSLARPLETWWGGRFFPGGFPYIASAYVGPLALALVPCGLAARSRRERLLLGGAILVACAYALGPAGGLWTLMHDWPFVRMFRYPCKALFTAHMLTALVATAGADRLRAGHGWHTFAWIAGLLAAVCAAVGAAPLLQPALLADWLFLDARALNQLRAELPLDAARSAAVALLGVGLAWAARSGRVPAPRATALVALVTALDLARAGAGLNPQVPATFFDLLPGLRDAQLGTAGSGRVFPSPALRSHTFRAWLDSYPPGADAWAFWVDRQTLDPYTNLIDRVETAATVDRTGFVAQPSELHGADYAPGRIAAVLPRLRNAAVTRILSLDPLLADGLALRAAVPLPRTPLRIHVYEVEDAWPRAYVACRARVVSTPAEAGAVPYAAGFNPRRDVALESAPDRPPGFIDRCATGQVRAGGASAAGRERWSVESDGPGWLVIRASHARGWQAAIDGRPVPVLRANGRQRAVPLPGGRHDVELRYVPPGLQVGCALTGAALLAALGLAVASPRRPPLSTT